MAIGAALCQGAAALRENLKRRKAQARAAREKTEQKEG
jgi:hypothetical protein